MMPASSSLSWSMASARCQVVPDRNPLKARARSERVSSVAVSLWLFRIVSSVSFLVVGEPISDQTIASCVPARFNHASLMPEARSSSWRIGLARLPQPISRAAGHVKGTA